MQKQPLLELKDIGKSFPGTRALDGVNLEVHPGEVVALLGENGAGKSTLMKILSGVWPTGTYEGEIRIAQKTMEFKDTRDAHRAGIAMIHQELSVFPELSVGEHLELDRLPRWIHWDSLHRRVQEFLDRIGLGLNSPNALTSKTRVGDLPVGGRQLVEIARALYQDANILVFDEPTSALTEQEVRRLYTIVDQLRAQGKAIIYITHRLDEVFRLADRMIVLRDGSYVGETYAKVDGKPIPRAELEAKLITWMVGRAIEDIYPPRNMKVGKEILRVQGLTLTSPHKKVLVKDLSFTLREGEILGLAGLLGAGRSETFEALFGVLNETGPRGSGYGVEGRVWIRARLKNIRTPAEALTAKVGFVSEDRKGTGLNLKQSILKNMTLPSIAGSKQSLTSGPRVFSSIYEKREESVSALWMRELKIKAAHLHQKVGELSGGNQQKVVLAKWLLTEPEILFLDEPTRGIDVGAKVEIYHWIQKLAAQGLGVVVASSEMPELLGICHRIIVLRQGHPSADLFAEKTNQEEIMRAASL